MAERLEFERWLLEVHGLASEWQQERNCYKEFAAHLAWCAWQCMEDVFQGVMKDNRYLAAEIERLQKREKDLMDVIDSRDKALGFVPL